MEQERFDHLVRGLASGLSRREMVRDLAGAAIGGILIAVGVSEAGARKKKQRSDKHQGRKKQGSGNHQEQAGASAIKGPCKAPNIKCGKGKKAQCCASGEVCQNGGCVTPCVPDCDGKCGGVPNGCGGTCDAACPGTCETVGCPYPCSCRKSVDGVAFCTNGGYCRGCTSDAGCAVPGDSTVYYCIDHGTDICGAGYTTTCMTPTCG